MIGAALALIVVTGTGIVGGPLGTLLLIGLLLLCPLMMLGMHGGGGRPHGHEHAPGLSGPPPKGVDRHGR
jgi:Protein of unknown function (DUF2933)